jgi:hypothetical protein
MIHGVIVVVRNLMYLDSPSRVCTASFLVLVVDRDVGKNHCLVEVREMLQLSHFLQLKLCKLLVNQFLLQHLLTPLISLTW